jgi:hypothetical protein
MPSTLPLHLQVASEAQKYFDLGTDVGHLVGQAIQALALEIRSLTTPTELGGVPLTAETFYERQACHKDAHEEWLHGSEMVIPWPHRHRDLLDGQFVTALPDEDLVPAF